MKKQYNDAMCQESGLTKSTQDSKKIYNLTDGGILQKLLMVSLPVMGSNLLQMIYNLVDMFWLGRLGADAIAASGTAGMFMWLSVGFMIIGRMGASIGVSQQLGRGDVESAEKYAKNAVLISLAVGLLYGTLLIVFRSACVGFFGITDPNVVKNAELYLSIIGIGIPFTFLNSTLDGMFGASGNSKTPFRINIIGVTLNLILDPVLIFVFDWGIAGAAIATIAAQAVTCCVMIIASKKSRGRPFEHFRLFGQPSKSYIKQILKWSVPIGLESMFFTAMGMMTMRFTASFGTVPMAVGRVGSQVESLTWLVGGGYGVALTSFMGQNYGAGKFSRIHRGFKISLIVMTIYGACVTAIMFFGGGLLVSLFMNEAEYIPIGVNLMRITCICQIPQCVETAAASTFKGMGKTVHPSIVSVISNIIRVIFAWVLSRPSFGLGVYGVWWGICLAAIVRGVWMLSWYLIFSRRQPQTGATILL